MIRDMSNPSKAKGDRAEREAVFLLIDLAPDMVLDNARRKLGAGRKDDMGDLEVFTDVTIQVKSLASVTNAVRQAADGAIVQAGRARTTHALGMAPIPRASQAREVRWLASTYEWPTDLTDSDIVLRTGTTEAAVRHIRQKNDSLARDQRITLISRSGKPDMYVSSIEAWLRAFGERVATGAAPHDMGHE
jgi:hypothetical protein